MKEKIKELRLKIDGLSQLVKPLRGESKYLINIRSKPEHLDIENWMKIFEERNYLFVNGNDETSRELTQSNEIQKCYDSLILAKAWLGKILGELGEATPYINDGNRKEVKDIESVADKAVDIRNSVGAALFINKNTGNLITTDTTEWLKMSHIEKVDWLREEIKHLLKFYIDLHPEEVRNDNKHPNVHYYKLYYKKCLEEARFWLGFELQRIKENK